MPATTKNQIGQAFDTLESRCMPAATVTAALTNGVLYVEGTNYADRIQVSEANNQMSASSNGTRIGIHVGSGTYASVATTSVSKVVVSALAGDDVVELGAVASGVGISRPAELHGGDGNDRLIGGRNVNVFDGGIGFNTYGQPIDFAHPVVGGCRVDDIQQQQLGTCQTLSSLGAAVNQGWDFGQQITYRGQTVGGAGLYDVALAGSTQRVTFDGTWTDQDPAPTNGQHESWVIIMQRARLQTLFGTLDWTRKLADDATLDRLSNYRYGNSADALHTLTGHTTQTMSAANISIQTLASLAGRIVVAGSVAPGGSEYTVDGIAKGHAYAIVAVSTTNGGMVRVYNPWHVDSSYGAVTGANDGFIDLTLTQFRRSFSGIAVA
jgi:hypothetical protein